MIVVVIERDLRDIQGSRRVFPKMAPPKFHEGMREFESLEFVAIEKLASEANHETVPSDLWWALDLDTGKVTVL